MGENPEKLAVCQSCGQQLRPIEPVSRQKAARWDTTDAWTLGFEDQIATLRTRSRLLGAISLGHIPFFTLLLLLESDLPELVSPAWMIPLLILLPFAMLSICALVAGPPLGDRNFLALSITTIGLAGVWMMQLHAVDESGSWELMLIIPTALPVVFCPSRRHATVGALFGMVVILVVSQRQTIGTAGARDGIEAIEAIEAVGAVEGTSYLANFVDLNDLNNLNNRTSLTLFTRFHHLLHLPNLNHFVSVAHLAHVTAITLFNLLILRVLRETTDTALHRAWQGELTDPLTGLANRRAVDRLTASAWRGGIRPSSSLAILLIDLDGFKQVNDTLGHIGGDHLLCRAASLLREVCRDDDLVVRLGGDEFLVFASSRLGRATQVAERIRVAVEQHLSPVTVSIGVYQRARADLNVSETLWQAIDGADRALYQAKKAGRNRIVISE